MQKCIKHIGTQEINPLNSQKFTWKKLRNKTWQINCEIYLKKHTKNYKTIAKKYKKLQKNY